MAKTKGVFVAINIHEGGDQLGFITDVGELETFLPTMHLK